MVKGAGFVPFALSVGVAEHAVPIFFGVEVNSTVGGVRTGRNMIEVAVDHRDDIDDRTNDHLSAHDSAVDLGVVRRQGDGISRATAAHAKGHLLEDDIPESDQGLMDEKDQDHCHMGVIDQGHVGDIGRGQMRGQVSDTICRTHL